MGKRHLDELNRVLAKVLGDWWQDDRRWWCAYCGIPMRRKAGAVQANSLATRDHVIPKAVLGGKLCIPACRECNVAKGAASLPEFLRSPYFETKRLKKHKNQWALWELWFASGQASFTIAATVKEAKVPAKSMVEPKERQPGGAPRSGKPATGLKNASEPARQNAAPPP